MGMNKDGYDDAEHWMGKNVEEVKEERRKAMIEYRKKAAREGQGRM